MQTHIGNQLSHIVESIEERKESSYIRGIIDTMDTSTPQCFLPSNVKAFLMDNNTTANTMTDELLVDIKQRMVQVKEARSRYAVIQILQAKLHNTSDISKAVRDIILSFQKDSEGFDAVLEVIEQTNEANKHMLEKEIAIGYYLRHKCLQITVKQ